MTRFTESQNLCAWQRPLRSPSPTVHLPTCPRPSVPHPHGSGTPPWTLTLPAPQAAVPVPSRSFSKDFLPHIQRGALLVQLEAIPSHPITVAWEKRLTPTSLQPSFRQLYGVVRPLLSLLQMELSQVTVLLLMGLLSRPFPALLPFQGHTAGPPCFSCSEGPRTEHSS